MSCGARTCRGRGWRSCGCGGSGRSRCRWMSRGSGCWVGRCGSRLVSRRSWLGRGCGGIAVAVDLGIKFIAIRASTIADPIPIAVEVYAVCVGRFHLNVTEVIVFTLHYRNIHFYLFELQNGRSVLPETGPYDKE